MSASHPQGQLCIWTDTAADPVQEADFKAWYDRELRNPMPERG